MVYYGFWYTAKMDALMAFIREAQKPVSGEVGLNLYKGNIMVDDRHSPNSLYDEGIASMEGGPRTIRPTPRDSCGSKGCRCACKAASAADLLRHRCITPAILLRSSTRRRALFGELAALPARGANLAAAWPVPQPARAAAGSLPPPSD